MKPYRFIIAIPVVICLLAAAAGCGGGGGGSAAPASRCGNGIIDGGEYCDDGDRVSGDGCSSTCVSETSGQTVFAQRTSLASGDDYGYSVRETTDGGYIAVAANSYNTYLIKFDSAGDEEWDVTYGQGSYDKAAYSLQQTTDGGYIIAGSSESSGHGDRFWVSKLESQGDVEWEALFGDTYGEARSVSQTFDGGYIAAGYRKKPDSSENEIWIIKLNSSGDEEWDKTFGGNSYDAAYLIKQTLDGGYIAVGVVYSSEQSYYYGGDFWVVKLSAYGNTEWEKNYGGNDYTDTAKDVIQTPDGDYIVVGDTQFGNYNIWVLKIDPNGIRKWARSLGRSSSSEYSGGIAAADGGGYVIAGNSSFGNKDLWFVKITDDGDVEWNRYLGWEDLSERVNSIQPVSDGGYIVTGYSSPSSNYDDFMIMKLDTNCGCEGCFEE